MRVAVFSDIHGNPYACEAVLQAIEADASVNGAFAGVVVAGDLCSAGSEPARCVDMLQAADIIVLCGNTEHYICDPDQPPSDELHRTLWDKILPVVHWTRDRLGPKRVDWLHSLPFDHCFRPTADPSDDLLVVHANPSNVDLQIYPSEDEQKKLWGEIRQPDDSTELEAVMAGTEATVIAFGHFHYASVRPWRDKILVNVAPCSISPYDNDTCARYTALTWSGNDWNIVQHRVPYDAKRQANALRASDMPEAERFAKYFE